MEELDLKELFKFFVSKIVIVICFIIIFCVMGFTYVNCLLTPMYHSSATLILVSEDSNKNSTSLQSDITVNKNLVTTYSQIVRSRTVLNQVIDNLKLDITSEQLSSNISVTAVDDTEIMKIQVSNENNKLAQKIALEISKIFMKEVKNIYNLSNVSVIDEASYEEIAYNVNPIKQIGLAGIIGLFIGGFIVFLIFYFDTSIKSAEEVEEKLGLAVIGNVKAVSRK